MSSAPPFFLFNILIHISTVTIHLLASPHYLNLLNHSWPSNHLVVSLISSQGYFTFLYKHTKHNREGGRKENKQSQTWVSSKHKKGKVCDTCVAFCASMGYCKHVFERNSHTATRNADSFSHAGQPGF